MVLFQFPRMSYWKIKEIVRKQSSEHDAVIFITGPEGSGKSTIECLLINMIHELQGKDTINLKGIMAFKLYDFMALWGRAKKASIVALDEGKELMGVNFQNKIVKDFERKMTSLRIESHIYIICITNPFKVMRYLREDKISYIFHCMNRSKVRVFKGDAFRDILEGIKDFKSTKLLDDSKSFIYEESFQPVTGSLWEQYMALKDAFKTAEKRDMEEAYKAEYADDVVEQPVVSERMYTQTEAAKKLGIGVGSMFLLLKKKQIAYSRNVMGKPLIPESALHAFILKKKEEMGDESVFTTLTLPKGEAKKSKTDGAVPI